MEAQALARQGVVIDRLPQQRVPEGIGRPVSHCNENMVLRGLAERREQRGLIRLPDLPEQPVVDGASDDGRGPEHLLGPGGETHYPEEECLAQRARQRLAAAAVGARQQLLGEEGVPLAASQDAVDHPRRRTDPRDCG